MKRLRDRLLLFTEIAIGTFALDQIVKWWVMGAEKKLPIVLIPQILQIELFKNTGIAFSIPLPSISIVPLILVLLVWGAWYLHRELDLQKPLAVTALGLILGGTIGNLFDRVRLGFVVDYISVWKFPVFNIADAAITVGIGMLILWYGVLEKK